VILSSDPTKFRDDLFNIARTTLSSKVLSQDKDYFANLAVDAVLRLQVCINFSFCVLMIVSTLIPLFQGSTDLDHIQIIKKVGGKLTDSYLDEGNCLLFYVLCRLTNMDLKGSFWISKSLPIRQSELKMQEY
jgi:chaperonin GroEL (HSP60 family)